MSPRIWVLKCLQRRCLRTTSLMDNTVSATKVSGHFHHALTRPAVISVQHRLIQTSSIAALRMFDEKNNLLIPPENANYFEVFDYEPSFDLDVRDLSQRFRDMQVLLHPDKHGLKSDSQRDLSDRWSSLVNNAYQTLLKPLSRALYVLEMNGRQLEEGEIGTEVTFLGEIMELNERLDEVESLDELTGLSEQNLVVVNDYVSRVSATFKSGDIDQARELIAKMKYYCTLQEKIVVKEMEMGSSH